MQNEFLLFVPFLHLCNTVGQLSVHSGLKENTHVFNLEFFFHYFKLVLDKKRLSILERPSVFHEILFDLFQFGDHLSFIFHGQSQKIGPSLGFHFKDNFKFIINIQCLLFYHRCFPVVIKWSFPC
jgi:hypothetical protein